MESKLILNLRLEIGDQKKTFSLMNLVFDEIKQLEGSNIRVEYFELRLRRLEGLPAGKESYMKIDANNATFTDSEISNHWDEAILNPCARLKERFLHDRCQTPEQM